MTSRLCHEATSTQSHQQQQQQQQQLMLRNQTRHYKNNGADRGDEYWVESVMELAQSCKKLFTSHTCRLCQVYVDEQVEFEQRQEQQQSAFPFYNMNALEVELYRQFLFDEESVIEGVTERTGQDEEAEEPQPECHDRDEQATVTTQRTY